jgi:hypothetical protein
MAAGAEEGKSLKEFFTEAVSDRLRGNAPPAGNGEPWRVALGVALALDAKSLSPLILGDVALGRPLPVRTRLAIPVIVLGKHLFGHSRNRVSYEQRLRERLDLWIASDCTPIRFPANYARCPFPRRKELAPPLPVAE